MAGVALLLIILVILFGIGGFFIKWLFIIAAILFLVWLISLFTGRNTGV